ncbi:MAG: putative Acyl-CoA dehydrogenase [Subtercola sp.]|nr:putative Acyl-CoA dehydrogenase [Subtercola sp.]
MDLVPSDDQLSIAEAAAELLSAVAPTASLARRRDDSVAISDSAWGSIAEAGLLGIGLPDRVGGADAGMQEETMLFREVGRQLAPGPLLSTVLAAHIALDSGDEALAAEFAAGSLRAGTARSLQHTDHDAAAVLNGELMLWDSTGSTWLVVVTADGAGLVQTDQLLPLRPERSIDPGTRLGSAFANDVPLSHWTPGDTTCIRALVLVAAQLVGIAEACRDAAVTHAKTREQFGRPIGVNQAIKHACVDMTVAAEQARAQLFFAAASCDGDLPDARFQAHAARVIAANAARDNAAKNIQIHGGMGFTMEFEGHLHVVRTETLGQQFGTNEASLEAVLTTGAPQ